MEKINACLNLCDELIEAIDQGDLELASNLARQLAEQAAGMQSRDPENRDGAVVSTLLSKLNQALSNGNLESAKACVQLLQILLMEEAAWGISGES